MILSMMSADVAEDHGSDVGYDVSTIYLPDTTSFV